VSAALLSGYAASGHQNGTTGLRARYWTKRYIDPEFHSNPLGGPSYCTTFQDELPLVLQRHHGVDILHIVLEFFGVHLIFLPAYSPELNPCELVFNVVKAHVRNYRDGFSPLLTKFFWRCQLFLRNSCGNSTGTV